MAELEISDFDAATDFALTSILHTKERSDNSDRNVTVQDVVDLVPTPTVNPTSTSDIDTEQDEVVISKAPGFDLQRLPFADFVEALGVATTGGDINSGNFNIAGWHVRWGNATSNADVSQSFPFSTPFPNECFGVMLTRTGSAASSSFQMGVSSVSTTGFTIDRNDGINSAGTFFYLAVGR